MTNSTILIPRRMFLEAEEFYRSMDDGGVAQALRDCQTEHEAQFMPSLIDARIESPADSRIWQTWWTSPSIRATGKTKQGNLVVVYAHIPNYFSNPDNIETAKEQGLRNGAGIMPQGDFQKLLELDKSTSEQGDRLVWVVDYKTFKNSLSDVVPLKDALKHPQTIPFLGGEERAEKYLDKYKENYGETIGIWHTDDLLDKPVGRVLYVGDNYGDALLGDYGLDGSGRFAGVKKVAEGDSPQKIRPSIDTICQIIQKSSKELEQRLRTLGF